MVSAVFRTVLAFDTIARELDRTVGGYLSWAEGNCRSACLLVMKISMSSTTSDLEMVTSTLALRGCAILT